MPPFDTISTFVECPILPTDRPLARSPTTRLGRLLGVFANTAVSKVQSSEGETLRDLESEASVAIPPPGCPRDSTGVRQAPPTPSACLSLLPSQGGLSPGRSPVWPLLISRPITPAQWPRGEGGPGVGSCDPLDYASKNLNFDFLRCWQFLESNLRLADCFPIAEQSSLPTPARWRVFQDRSFERGSTNA